MSSTGLRDGVVKWFNDSKGYGFLLDSDDGRDVFVSYRAVQGEGFKSLSEGQQVEFERSESAHDPQADRVWKQYASDVDPAPRVSKPA